MNAHTHTHAHTHTYIHTHTHANLVIVHENSKLAAEGEHKVIQQVHFALLVGVFQISCFVVQYKLALLL